MAAKLAHALGVSPDDPSDELTHGFHAYPARMHPWTARRLLEAFAARGGSVLDPFCGSGTVLVEARIAGLAAYGGEIHPLAVRIARLKCRSLPPALLRPVVAEAGRVSGRAAALSRRSRGEQIPGFQAARAFWQPHIARDLLALQAVIRDVRDADVREVLWLVLSSLAVKVSDRASDTDARISARKVASGKIFDLFPAKARELADRSKAFSARVPAGTPEAQIEERDARARSSLATGSIHLVVTSPPYPGTYDYVDHHAMRVWLLGVDASRAAAQEIGARRRAGRGWREGIEAAVVELARVLRPGGLAIALVGDGLEGEAPVDAGRAAAEAGVKAGLRLAATAWQERPCHSAPERRFLGPTKKETLVALQKG